HEAVDVAVRGAALEVSPVTETAAVVVTGAEVRELGAAAAVAVLQAQGASVEVEGGRLRIRLPAA
ncbi:MAG: hypothetical protein M3327_00415, partial [Actinomycetota bacterium]|nr:hypothetical protein [Actinomycetota bacterium]